MPESIKIKPEVITRKQRNELAIKAFNAKKKIMELGYFRAIWCAAYPELSSRKDITYVHNVCSGRQVDVDITEKLESIVETYASH